MHASAGPTPRYLNGRFLTRRTTGVERAAGRLIDAIDRRLGDADPPWTLLCPPGADVPPLRRVRVRTIGPARLPGHAWEQLVLPAAARDGLLVNLAGGAPLAARRQLCTIHDAAVFDRPQAYTRAFVAWYRFLFRRLARRADALVTVSTFSRDRLAHALGVPPERIDVVPNGGDHLDGVTADPTILERLGVAPRRFLLAVGSPHPNKNLARLLDAYRRLGAADTVPLVIVGAGNDRIFAADGAEADPPGTIRAGALPDPALKALYRHARALVFPSLYEGFGLPPIEAMGEGCPVVASALPPIREVCGEAALLVDPASVDAIAGAMRRVLDDDALCAALRDAGLRRAAGRTWDAAAARLLALVGALR